MVAADAVHEVGQIAGPVAGPRGIEDQATQDDLAAGIGLAGEGGGAGFQRL
jgi:hypothetical protein